MTIIIDKKNTSLQCYSFNYRYCTYLY